MKVIQLTLTFIPFEEETPEKGRMIICLREMGGNGSVEVETCETDDEFLYYYERNSYTHWCYLPIIKT